ncbi:hypothetical protein BLA60_14895 [Actinophytocola xinjiangensis]|uniref:Uncharacterized protein n=1 Tax=Actinophytocola xinjiangensis TaxID=485602 RepID=A0A7Z0WMV4_9PSEU|nr:hypothetical protein BLA60_14895 [Actinophytocola xinjiangensis]
MTSPRPISNNSQPDNSHIIAPYVTAWSEEMFTQAKIVRRPSGGIAYADEKLTDRDNNGILWPRTPHRPGIGRPEFGAVHPLRQRRAMRRLLCQVCAGPADQTPDGTLWLLQDHREDWPNWPENMAVTEPPVCRDCVTLSTRLCPALRKGSAVIRARRFPIVGVYGVLHTQDPTPTPVGTVTLSFDNSAVRWLRAGGLARELHDCAILTPDDLHR